jgi:hypothetical protein
MMEADDLAKYQVKSVTPVDHYVCTLSEDTQKRAFEEFGETEELRQKSIKEMRDWILNNPRILKCRMDSKSILRYLRHHNYDMDCVKESFERALIFRQNFEFLSDLDFEKPNMKELLDAGLIVILPGYTKTGERIICTKLSAASPKIPKVAHLGLCLATQIFEVLLEDEETQVRGFHYIFDVSDVTLKHYFVLPFLTWFKILKNCERSYSGRHRGCHVLNFPNLFSFVCNIGFKHMHTKMKNGIHFYSNVDELEIIDKDELPSMMGGTMADSTFKEIIESWKQKLTDFRPFLKKYSEQSVDLDSYASSVANCEVKSLAHRLENPKAKLTKN